MNRLKDIIYDKNDIVIALFIVVIAGLLIYNRIDVIMDYPSVLAAEAVAESSEGEESSLDPSIENENEIETGTEIDTETETETDTTIEEPTLPDPVAGQTTGQPTVDQVSVYIEYGSTGSQIAQILVDSGLITSKDQFYDAVAAAGADTKLQAGSFKIPSDATPAKIISIITN